MGNFFKASGTPANPKVTILWNRYYTNEGLLEIYRQLERAHPDLVVLKSIGKSYEGRDLWLLTVTNHNNRPHSEKPAFWVDGNIHANEIQAAEVSLYTAWYLVENYGKNEFITGLLNEKVFYILPVMNPDGREHYMNQPNTASSPRSGTIPLDNDGDGLMGEDATNDLNKDGHITQMRRRTPYGNLKTHLRFVNPLKAVLIVISRGLPCPLRKSRSLFPRVAQSAARIIPLYPVFLHRSIKS
ncbi:MAG: M14 family zinc carboxypeptidase [Bacteroidota bacterium]